MIDKYLDNLIVKNYLRQMIYKSNLDSNQKLHKLNILEEMSITQEMRDQILNEAHSATNLFKVDAHRNSQHSNAMRHFGNALTFSTLGAASGVGIGELTGHALGNDDDEIFRKGLIGATAGGVFGAIGGGRHGMNAEDHYGKMTPDVLAKCKGLSGNVRLNCLKENIPKQITIFKSALKDCGNDHICKNHLEEKIDDLEIELHIIQKKINRSEYLG